MLNAATGAFGALMFVCLFFAWVYSLLATRHSRVLTCLAVAFAMLATFCIIMSARAQDHSEGHAAFHDVYQTWRTPGSGVSCCNEKKTENGHTTGDCYPTTAILAPAGAANPDVKGDVWWALLDDGRWLEIPDGRIVHEINPDETGSRAHVCIMDGSTVPLCFVPPTGGS